MYFPCTLHQETTKKKSTKEKIMKTEASKRKKRKRNSLKKQEGRFPRCQLYIWQKEQPPQLGEYDTRDRKKAVVLSPSYFRFHLRTEWSGNSNTELFCTWIAIIMFCKNPYSPSVFCYHGTARDFGGIAGSVSILVAIFLN